MPELKQETWKEEAEAALAFLANKSNKSSEIEAVAEGCTPIYLQPPPDVNHARGGGDLVVTAQEVSRSSVSLLPTPDVVDSSAIIAAAAQKQHEQDLVAVEQHMGVMIARAHAVKHVNRWPYHQRRKNLPPELMQWAKEQLARGLAPAAILDVRFFHLALLAIALAAFIDN